MLARAIGLVIWASIIASAAAGADLDELLRDDFATLDPAWGEASEALGVDAGALFARPAAGRNRLSTHTGLRRP